MRLLISKSSAEERLVELLNEGYKLRQSLWCDYDERRKSTTFDPISDIQRYYALANAWTSKTLQVLREIFPTDLEANYFANRGSHLAGEYMEIDQKFGVLYYRTLPDFIERLKSILDINLSRYTDLPIQKRLFVEDIDSFIKVRDVNPAMVGGFLENGFLKKTEDEIQLALEQILGVSFHKKDWGGELNDLYTANVIVNSIRRATAFLLKGPGIGKKEMAIADCGKNGDQIVRLFATSADLFVVQYVGPISDMLITDVQGKTSEIRAIGKTGNFLIIDGQDTARLLYAYGKL
jgi:hypothetical protein